MNSLNTNDKTNLYLRIVLGVLVILIFVLGSVNIFLLTSRSNNNSSNPDTTQNDTPDNSDIMDSIFTKKPEEITEEEANQALKVMTEPDYIPKNLLDPALTPEGAKKYFILEYSYEDLDDIREADYHISDFNKYELDITPVDDSYAVVTAVENGAIVPERYVGVAFNKKYLNYYEERIQNEDSGSSTEHLQIIDKSDQFIRKALPILYASLAGSVSGLYSYEIEDQDDRMTFIAYSIGIGIDLEKTTSANDIQYVINVYSNKCSISKITGDFEWVINEKGNRNTIIKSFPISQLEATNYLSKQS